MPSAAQPATRAFLPCTGARGDASPTSKIHPVGVLPSRACGSRRGRPLRGRTNVSARTPRDRRTRDTICRRAPRSLADPRAQGAPSDGTRPALAVKGVGAGRWPSRASATYEGAEPRSGKGIAASPAHRGRELPPHQIGGSGWFPLKRRLGADVGPVSRPRPEAFKGRADVPRRQLQAGRGTYHDGTRGAFFHARIARIAGGSRRAEKILTAPTISSPRPDQDRNPRRHSSSGPRARSPG